jgi:hypothetical protein
MPRDDLLQNGPFVSKRMQIFAFPTAGFDNMVLRKAK